MIEVSTKILTEESIDYLEFTFSNDVVRVNINDATDSVSLKSVFNKIVKLLLTNDVSMKSLEVDESMDKRLLIEVFQEYIKDLNQEVIKIRAQIRASEGSDE